MCSTHYIERWLKAPMQMPDGCLVAREKGPYRRTPLQDLELMVEHDDLDVFLEPTGGTAVEQRLVELCARLGGHGHTLLGDRAAWASVVTGRPLICRHR